MSCDDCVKGIPQLACFTTSATELGVYIGVKHDGVFEGQLTDIGGIKCYVSTPKSDFASTKAILFLSDGFGITLINNQLIIDDFARNGFKTIAPDILFGDPVPEDFMSGKREFSFPAWLLKHTNEVTRSIIDKVLLALKDEGITHLGVVGYCFGGRYCFDLAFENIATVVVVNHPSLLESPKDLEKYAELSRAPLLINSCTHDQAFPLDAQEKAD
ncbi:hypothetical protein ONZ45_g10926 [Pleurotus djamor]|nr:hypothetical protein ONZ45_g10926 [Pleurotus djamor]